MMLELATVMVVNVAEYSVDVLTEDTHRSLLGVPIMQPLSHPDHGGGITFLPEVGAKCWICTPGDSTSAFLLGFMWNAPTQTEARQYDGDGPNFTGMREPMEPGDIRIGTVDGNSVVIRRGGVLQLGASGICQRVYVPIGNVIRDYFQRYHAVSPLGEISWSHARLLPSDGDNLDGVSIPTLLKYGIKLSLQDDVSGGNPYPIELRIGTLVTPLPETASEQDKKDASIRTPPDMLAEERHVFRNKKMVDTLEDAPGSEIPSAASTVVSLEFVSPDNTKRRVTYAFQLSRTGDRYEMAGGHVLSECGGSYVIQARKDVILRGGAQVSGSDDEVTRFSALRTFLKKLQVSTPFGPSGFILPSLALELDQDKTAGGNIGSAHVKVSK